MRQFLLVFFALFLFACGDDALPKPKAYLRLDYPLPKYKRVETPLPFTFEKNNFSSPIEVLKTSSKAKGIDLKYNPLKATIYLTYKEVTSTNLDTLLRDAQNLAQKHTIKANEILQTPYINEASKVYGMFYEIGGNAASQSQFYVTDSTKHFLSGSLYFYAKPNYDSILPAAEYLKKDMRHLIETINWK